MFSRLYNRNVVGNNQSSGKSNRIRITLKDRINSSEAVKFPITESSSFINHGEGDHYSVVRRSNTIGRIIQNGSQQIFYPINPNNNFTRQPVRGCYNSNIVQNNHSNFQPNGSVDSVLSSRRSNEFNTIQSLRSTSNLASKMSSNVVLEEDQEPRIAGNKVKSMTSSIPLNLIEKDSAESLKSSINSQINEIEDSENERLNSNRNKYGLSIDLYSLTEDSTRKIKPELPVELECSINQTNKNNEIFVRSISLQKEKLPNLEIFPLETPNSPNSKSNNRENCELRRFTDNHEIAGLISKLNKSAFYFVRFNLLLHLAAIVIQCYFRRYICKKYLYFRKYGPIKLLNTSAMQIQACWRSFLTRFGASLCEGTPSNNASHKCINEYNWSILHEKNFTEIVKRRNQNARCIQNFWRNIYLKNINIEREILTNSIFSARALAKETIEKFLLGYLVRKSADSRYKLVPIKWSWSVQEISEIFILQKIRNRWSEPKKMWFNQEENVYRYNLFLSNGIHQVVFKVYYKNKECNKDQEYTILCNSSLETIPSDEFQFVNNISVYNNYTVSAFKYMRDRISYINFSTINYLESLNPDVMQNIEQDLGYIALSPSYKQRLDIEYSETEYENSPYKEFERIKSDVISTPSTNLDYSPGTQHFIH
ncbi:IQ calmodulin-binding motif family protein [Cryptosporidium meleagridis]|uniref:IQ calmodulin-binding motif family protein n=1 Tax=Cryptosporidium meleagridis TaxID=93969 RepID=A0A2P4YXH8_9CRYT|nr:IQ calmodulin-binding motif family protein [Cryptosporidium meleagridis]